jgi:outer membrane protein assembly factor BamB
MNTEMVSLDSSGQLRWTFEHIGWMAPIPNTGFTPAIAADGTIYVNGRFSLFAVASNGIMRWKYDFPRGTPTDPVERDPIRQWFLGCCAGCKVTLSAFEGCR